MQRTIRRSSSRVVENTDPKVNDQIRRKTAASILFYTENPDLIPRRLRELDHEWDIERALAVGSSSLSLLGLTMGLRRGSRWLLLPLAVQGFFLQHAVQGWCPPMVVLRRAGFRTVEEIEEERHALRSALEESGGLDEYEDEQRERRENRDARRGGEMEMKPGEPAPASHDGA